MTTESHMDKAGPAMDMLVTALHPPHPAQVVRVQPVNYISIDDFMQEQIRLDEENDRKDEIKSPPSKKQKNAVAIDPATFRLEEEAIKAMGDENWIGLLQRYSDVHPHHKVKYEELTIEKPLPRFQCIVSMNDSPERFGATDEQALTFSNKKLAKQYASKKAIDWLRGNNHMTEDGGVKFAIPTLLSPPPSELEHEESALLTIGDKNWVGCLDDWAKVKWGGKKYPRYEELIIGTKAPRFQCTVALDGFPISFGCIKSESQQVVTFSSKKPAKQFAAKQVIDWLIANGHMPDDGSVSFPKSAPLSLPPRTAIPAQGLSYAAQVADLCHRLSFQAPKYILKPAYEIPNCPLWDGHADFAGNPRIGDEGKVGHVRNIVGKKNAKEALAEQVYTFLKGVEAHRLGQYEGEDKKRKRSPDSSQNKKLSDTTHEVNA